VKNADLAAQQIRFVIILHKTLKMTGDERHLQKTGVVKVSSKCRQNPKNDGSRKSQKGKMP